MTTKMTRRAGLLAGLAAMGWVAATAPAVAQSTQMQAGADHSHPLREVASETDAPTVTHLVFPDAMDGYNIQLLTGNFRFAPASINRAVEENAGHAHIYVNGQKISRVYGAWHHLPAAYLRPGANLVSVTLNANDHSVWAVDGVPVASTVRVIVKDQGS